MPTAPLNTIEVGAVEYSQDDVVVKEYSDTGAFDRLVEVESPKQGDGSLAEA